MVEFKAEGLSDFLISIFHNMLVTQKDLSLQSLFLPLLFILRYKFVFLFLG